MATKTGKLFKKLEVQRGVSKKGKNWSKMTFVLDVTTDPMYTKYVAFDSFKGNVIEFIQDTNIGTPLMVEYDIESREWEGRWFSNVNASNVEVVRDNSSNGDHNGMSQLADIHNQEYQRANNVSIDDPSDDLPF